MPNYKATVIGENFEFLVDDEPQLLDFSRTIYVDAQDESGAQQAALAQVRKELLSQSLMDAQTAPLMSIDEICQIDAHASHELAEDFIWYFPDDDGFD